MEGNQVTRVFNERPVIFLIALAILAAFILGLIFFVYYALTNDHRDREGSRMGASCTDWRYESPVEKHLSGPDVQQMCERYFAARSPDDAQRDEAVWQHKIDVADATWQGHQR